MGTALAAVSQHGNPLALQDPVVDVIIHVQFHLCCSCLSSRGRSPKKTLVENTGAEKKKPRIRCPVRGSCVLCVAVPLTQDPAPPANKQANKGQGGEVVRQGRRHTLIAAGRAGHGALFERM